MRELDALRGRREGRKKGVMASVRTWVSEDNFHEKYLHSWSKPPQSEGIVLLRQQHLL